MSQSSNLLDNFAREIGEALGRLGLPPERMEEAVRDAIRPVLERMDLVTHEELRQYRQDLEETQRRLQAIEAQLGMGPEQDETERHFQHERLEPDPGDPASDYDPNEPKK